jgi:hypothetical protein
LFVNGAGAGTAGGVAGEVQYSWEPVYHADMFDPDAPAGKQWSQLAAARNIRFYHSEAVLLETGHVITAGSEMNNYGDYWEGRGGPSCFPNGFNACTNPFNYNLERFSPPYLQKAERNGRPVISKLQPTIAYNSDVDIEMETDADKVVKVHMVRYSSATHSINTDQKLLEVIIVRRTKLYVSVRIPWNSALAQPGNWMIFCIDEDNVPSVGKTVLLQLGPNGPINPNDPIILPSPVPAEPGSSSGRSAVSTINASPHHSSEWIAAILSLLMYFF